MKMTATFAGISLSEEQPGIEVEQHTLERFYLLSYRPGPCLAPISCGGIEHGQRWLYRCSCGVEGYSSQARCPEDMEAKVRRTHDQHRRRMVTVR